MRVIVFDFDDTLYSTSDSTMDVRLPSTMLETIQKLYSSSNYPNTKMYIVSNASSEWIYTVLNQLFPTQEILKYFEGIISVRDLNLKEDVSIWKSIAFHKFLDLWNANELIAFGDSKFDREASLNIKKSYPNIRMKNILFLSAPTSSILVDEHLFIQKNISWILECNEDLDLTVLYSGVL